jgi:hypothetical protein
VARRFINIYTLDRHYGGPEEGGWYYDSGEPVASLEVPEDADDEAVDAAVEALRAVWLYKGRVGSVLYPRDGYDFGVEVDDKPARAFPEERPHYE